MRPTILLTFLLAFSVASSPAQGTWGGSLPDPGEQAEQQTRMMRDSLGLSSAQTERIATVNATYALRQQEARDNSDGDFKALRETLRALQQEQDAELKRYLTSDQWTAWTRIRERQRQARMQSYRGRQ
ncbi:MAG: hypothetical protein R2787_14475 [Saprospiraceae bacterium]